MTPTLIAFFKAPRRGHVKTRLARDLGADAALEIYRRLAEEQWRRIPESWRAEVYFSPDDAEPEMRRWLGERGAFRPQGDGDLGARLARAFSAAFESGGAPVIAIGGDCPDLDATCLEEARVALRNADVVLGPATDGGYYLIGLSRPAPELFERIPWSSRAVLDTTLVRAGNAGLRVHLLRPKMDIDDAARWAEYRARSLADVTVIIPALNEASAIEQTVRSTRVLLPGAAVIVVDGGSTDGTPHLAEAAGATTISSARGRGRQLAAGAEQAKTEWLLFLHADTALPRKAAPTIARFIIRPESRIATFRLSFDHANWFLRACCWFTRFDSVFTRFGDQGILVRSGFYRALGGFPAWPLFEDVALLQRARRVTRVRSLGAAVTTSARRFEARGHLAQQWLNARLLFRYLLGASPEKLAEHYGPPRRRLLADADPLPPTPVLHETERSQR